MQPLTSNSAGDKPANRYRLVRLRAGGRFRVWDMPYPPSCGESCRGSLVSWNDGSSRHTHHVAWQKMHNQGARTIVLSNLHHYPVMSEIGRMFLISLPPSIRAMRWPPHRGAGIWIVLPLHNSSEPWSPMARKHTTTNVFSTALIRANVRPSGSVDGKTIDGSG